ncbi:MAG TPA: MarR family transcriptional regulator [Candidatus Eisenbacteria bacterium]|nr:MarR family transcriptional regulator [Candidatus Eisenbacteria bacterium]
MTAPITQQTNALAPTRLLELIRLHGPQTAQELADRLSIGPVSVRAQLRTLESANLVERSIEPRPLGRPVSRFRLTASADGLFPKRYDLFAGKLLETLVSELGIDALRKILTHWEEALAAHLDRRLPADPSARLDALAQHQSSFGFMAEVRRGPDGSVSLIERNCPIAALAARYPEICEREAALFSRTLKWKTTLTSCQARGDGVCVFRIGRPPRPHAGAEAGAATPIGGTK